VTRKKIPSPQERFEKAMKRLQKEWGTDDEDVVLAIAVERCAAVAGEQTSIVTKPSLTILFRDERQKADFVQLMDHCREALRTSWSTGLSKGLRTIEYRDALMTAMNVALAETDKKKTTK
jgi:hypothetical protein